MASSAMVASTLGAPQTPGSPKSPGLGSGRWGGCGFGAFPAIFGIAGLLGRGCVGGGSAGAPKMAARRGYALPTPSPPSRCGAMRETMVFMDKWGKKGCLYCFYPKRWLTGCGGGCVSQVFFPDPPAGAHTRCSRASDCKAEDS